MALIITLTDLPAALQAHELAAAWVAGANAKASRVAPCLAAEAPGPTDEQLAEARLVLIGAVSRWAQAGTGAISQQQAGPFGQSIDTRQRGGYALWPSEIESLQDICSSGAGGQKAFSVTPTGACGSHMPWCSLAFGALYCSCGSDINGYEGPLYEGGLLS